MRLDIDNNDIRKLDGGLLLVFRELGRTGRTTEAARRLGLSQSAVSHALARLRDVFDDPLFIRRPHGVEPTRRAQELAPQVEAILGLAASAIARTPAFDPARTERRFVICASAYVAVIFGGALTEALRTQAPHAVLLVRDLGPIEALDAVRRGEADLALGRFGAPPKGVALRRMLDDRYCVVARRGHPRIAGRMDLAAYCEIGHVYSGPTGLRGAVEDPIPAAAEVAVRAIVPTYMTALTLVATSEAIATVPRRLAEAVAELLGLQVLEPPFAPLPVALDLARRAEAADPAVDWLEQRLASAIGG